MPIRFRCAYCNQLLGISRRKANTVVRCPTCAGQIVVPNMETEEEAREQMVFERADFDKLLNAGGEHAVLVSKKEDPGGSDSPVALPAADNPSPRSPALAEPEYDVEKIELPAGIAVAAGSAAVPSGIFLSRAKATFLAIAVVVSLALAFGAGFLIGFLLQPAHEAPAPEQSMGNPVAVCSATSVVEDGGVGAGRGFGSGMASPVMTR